MITIPTGDLTGLLSDALPFAADDKEAPPEINCVRLEWDGTQLHALATDRYRIAWATWEPGDLAPGEDAQDDLFTEWGGADDPWAISLPLADAAEHIKVFKLPAKEARTPLTLDYDLAGPRLTVRRSRDTGYSAITIATDDLGTAFPGVRHLLARAQTHTAVKDIAYTAKYLADFAKVRVRGPLILTFTEGLTHVAIGDRFVGAILPVRLDGQPGPA